MKPRAEVPRMPTRRVCQCGATVRQVVDPDRGLVFVDEQPGLGRLIINIDRIVGLQSNRERMLGFRQHHFSRLCRLVA